MTRPSLLALFLLCLIPSFATAQVQEEERPSDDPVIEARLAKLSRSFVACNAKTRLSLIRPPGSQQTCAAKFANR